MNKSTVPLTWWDISEFPYDDYEMRGVTVLLYSKKFESSTEPDGIVLGFLVEGSAKDPRFEGGFWNDQSCAWECRECEPTRFAYLVPPASNKTGGNK